MRILALWAAFLVFAPSVQAGLRLGDIFAHTIPEADQVLEQFNQGRTQTTLPAKLKVVVWNTHKEVHPLMTHQIEEFTQTHDLFLGQEGWLLNPFVELLLRNPDWEWSFASSFYYQNKGTGVYTGARASAVKSEYRRSYYREPFIKSPKLALISYYRIEGTEKLLLTINLHALNVVAHYKNIDQLKELEKIIEKHDGPVIYAGDFNSWSKDRLTYLEEARARLGLTEVSFYPDNRKLFHGKNVFDHCYIRNLKQTWSQAKPRIGTSDHTAMEFEVEYQE